MFFPILIEIDDRWWMIPKQVEPALGWVFWWLLAAFGWCPEREKLQVRWVGRWVRVLSRIWRKLLTTWSYFVYCSPFCLPVNWADLSAVFLFPSISANRGYTSPLRGNKTQRLPSRTWYSGSFRWIGYNIDCRVPSFGLRYTARSRSRVAKAAAKYPMRNLQQKNFILRINELQPS